MKFRRFTPWIVGLSTLVYSGCATTSSNCKLTNQQKESSSTVRISNLDEYGLMERKISDTVIIKTDPVYGIVYVITAQPIGTKAPNRSYKAQTSDQVWQVKKYNETTGEEKNLGLYRESDLRQAFNHRKTR